MNKLFKKILTIALVFVCALSLIACADNDEGSSEKGLFCKKLGGVYTIYKYVDDGSTTELNIATELEKLGITDTNVRIQAQAFNGNASLTKIEVPASVTKIEKGAFAGMKALKELTIPFVGLNANADVAVGDTAPSADKAVDSERTIAHLFGETEYEEGIAQYIYYDSGAQGVTCYMPISLSKITVKGDNNIPASAFNGLSKYVQIVIDGNVKVIGDYAFANVSQLTEITLPTSVEKIGTGAFAASNNLAKINLEQLTSLKSIGATAFADTALTTVVTPASLERIYESAFLTCKSLTSLTLNDGLKNIDRFAFKDCEKLSQIVSTGVTAGSIELGSYAFYNCKDLEAANYDVAIYASVNANHFAKAN